MDWNALLNSVVGWATSAGIRLVIAFALLLISFKVINYVAKRIERSGEKKNTDKTIIHVLAYAFKIGAKAIVIVAMIGYVGIDTSGLTALIASFGVCVGLAVNGALSNLAGGVLILITRPFRIDDFIEAQGYSGTVEDIHITNTKICTPDNKIVYIPNGALSSGSIMNYSVKDLRRVDEVFGISYGADFNKAKQIIAQIAEAHPLVLKDQEIFVRVSEHADSAIKITSRVWVKSADYWTVKFDILEAVKERFDAEGIEIPFNQMDVHIRND